MIDTSNVVFVVWLAFKVACVSGFIVERFNREFKRTFFEVVAFEYARSTADSDSVDQYGACEAEKVDIGC